MPYPYFQELIQYHNDPKGWMNPPKTGEELEETRKGMMDGLERLRSSKD